MFISRDSIGLMGGDNVFQYAPNPTGWIDPFGLTAGVIGCAAGPIGCGVGISGSLVIALILGAGVTVSGDTPKIDSKTDDNPCTSGNCCPPCTPYPKGTIVYQGPETHSKGEFAGKAHFHIFVVNQNPNNCKCYWNNGKKSIWGHQYFGSIKESWINLNSSSKRPPNYPH